MVALALAGYDFIDFGASEGGSIEFARARLGGTKGVGIDIDPKKVEQMLQVGYDCIQGDITQLDLPPNSVRFVTMSHVLEHLPDLGAVCKAIECAAKVASEFLFIQGPYFDADEYLEGLGLRPFWSYWSGHRCHLKTEDLRSILLDLGLEDFNMQVYNKVKDSNDRAIHPWNSPINSHEYDPNIHPPKPSIRFSEPVYREMVCCVRLRPVENWKGIIDARRERTILEKVVIAMIPAKLASAVPQPIKTSVKKQLTRFFPN
ncbi:MAG: class I SAM-dependent methyltransferase [Deltaproteobacteria bacterium]|nr:class I SAM-dependent methyltransferase [Deltaproteobacteria bacterium]MBW2172473.1 class I SAM-dependent methyltransferase [Deltaproteobacteria bacterium]